MSPQPVPTSGGYRPPRFGSEADGDELGAHGSRQDSRSDGEGRSVKGHVVVRDEDSEEHLRAMSDSTHTIEEDEDEDDVEGHGLRLTLAVSGAIVLGSVAAGASVQAASTVLAPGAVSSSAAASTPTSTPGPVPALPGSAVASRANAANTSLAQGGEQIHTGLYVVPVKTSSVDVELA